MPTQQLLDQFNQLLSQSKSFKLLDPVQQSEVKTEFITATDDQLKEAIEQLKTNIANTEKKEAAAKLEQQKAAEEAQKLKDEVKTIEKEILKEDEVKDSNESSKAADDLISGFSKNSPKKDRRKLFGIF